MEKRIQAKARVQFTVEVETSLWGHDCTIGQLYKQAAEDGRGQIVKLIAESKCRASVIGEPKVIGVITENE